LRGGWQIGENPPVTSTLVELVKTGSDPDSTIEEYNLHGSSGHLVTLDVTNGTLTMISGDPFAEGFVGAQGS
jgi:hypothetical protein